MGKAKKKLSPKGRSTALGLLEQLRGCIAQLKDVLGKGPNQRSKIKSMLTDLAVVMKAAKEEGKELMTLARKAESVAPSAASSKRSKK